MLILCASCPQAFHYTSDAGLPKVIWIYFHGQSIDANRACHAWIAGPSIAALPCAAIVTRLFKNTLRNKVHPRTIRIHDSSDDIIRYIFKVSTELLGVLG